MSKYKKGEHSHKLLASIHVAKSFKCVINLFPDQFFYSNKNMFIISIFLWQNKNICGRWQISQTM